MTEPRPFYDMPNASHEDRRLFELRDRLCKLRETLALMHTQYDELCTEIQAILTGRGDE